MIHCYSLDEKNIVIDVNSGAVHLLDPLAYEMAPLCEALVPLGEECPEELTQRLQDRFDRSQIEEAYGELRELWQQGMLYTSDEYIDLEQYQLKYSPIKAMCLHVAHDCNLRCEYCFADTGEFRGKREFLSLETGKKAFDFLIEQSKGRRNLEVDFFGGEPLMNFDVVKELVRYGRELEKEHNKSFRFTITTNGVLLDEDKMKFINDNMSNVVLSIDGRPEVNDRVRKRVGGGGCYESIMPKMKEMAKLRNQDQYYVRGTFTKYNLDFHRDVLHMAENGFEQISIEPVVAEPTAPYAIDEEDLPEIFASYEALYQEMKCRIGRSDRFNFFHFMIDLEQGPCIIKRLGGCGSGNEYVAIAPSGDIYPCHQFVGMEEFRMGNVHTGEFDRTMKEKFSKINVYTKQECAQCWAKFYCSGGCNANNYQYGGGLDKPYRLGCEMEKKRLECAIALKAEAALR
ncbi:thioether cross-link-forming SCIFF peptide maturase [Feifania hominis]|uniref:Thioether cross-link-forming SCIFF peptide maturase n=1 Tax=Feifania hominis TaxID=2763660 RepID=A0A926HT74_9FIRM|nr:thioether cross-link-forming SCIFF peptide maturase [Feifania hominis]MBC8535579.1 thioether cross-link-forming SCIFF peptide maturase [Feifania hominis]